MLIHPVEQAASIDSARGGHMADGQGSRTYYRDGWPSASGWARR
jgi:hypothetical protein